MVDTAAVVFVLWEQVAAPYITARTASLCGSAGNCRAVMAFLAGLHDLGKISPKFTGKWPAAVSVLSELGFKFLPSLLRSRMALPHGCVTEITVPDLLTEEGTPYAAGQLIAQAIGAHHGLFATPQQKTRFIAAKRDLGEPRPQWDEARRTAYCALRDLLAPDLSQIRWEELQHDQAFHLLLAGLTSVVDWISSMEDYFPFAVDDTREIDLDKYYDLSRERAGRALDEIGWLQWSPGKKVKTFRDLFAFKSLRPLQEKTEVLAGRSLSTPVMVLIEAPMGEGKTEAAFYLQDWFQVRCGQRGMYLALPTQATSDQMLGRVGEFLAARYPKDKVNLHLMHGNSALSADYRHLRVSAVEYDNENDKGAVVAEEWFVPKKRSLLAPFGVGTIDQALLSVLQVRHGFVRLFGLAGKVVVIDEIHAYDTYTSTLVDRLLEWLSALGSSVILLSATLPRKRREELLKAYSGQKCSGIPEVSYPRITWATGEGRTGGLEFDAREQEPLEITWVGPDTLAIAKKLVRTLTGNGCAAWICNTVGKAQEVYSALKPLCRPEGMELSLLHARYLFADRQEREKKVLAAFGKNSLKKTTDPEYCSRPKKAILIATQVIEQSLDLDFDLMVTEPAPVDLVLQRSGRIHRHAGRDRPAGLKKPQLWLVNPPLSDEGIPLFEANAYVYSEYILFLSWLALRNLNRISIPQDVERLIEQVYSPGEILNAGEIEPRFKRHVKKTAAADQAKRREDWQKARIRVIKSPYSPESIMEQISRELVEDNPEAAPGIQAVTRLCRPSIHLVFLYRQVDGSLSLDKSGTREVELEKEVELELARALTQRSVTVSHPALVKHFSQKSPPRSWQKSGYLRYHRLVEIEDDKACGDGWEVRVDAELGIVITI